MLEIYAADYDRYRAMISVQSLSLLDTLALGILRGFRVCSTGKVNLFSLLSECSGMAGISLLTLWPEHTADEWTIA